MVAAVVFARSRSVSAPIRALTETCCYFVAGSPAAIAVAAAPHAGCPQPLALTPGICPACGVIVHYEIERRPDMISIPAGTFADPDFAEPRISVFGERKHDWLELGPGKSLIEE